MQTFQILLISQVRQINSVLPDLLKYITHASYQLKTVNSLTDANQAIQSKKYDLCLIEQDLLNINSSDSVKNFSFLPTIVLVKDYETGLNYLRQGAIDYLIYEQLNLPTLERSLRLSLATTKKYVSPQLQYRRRLETALMAISKKLATEKKVNLNRILMILGKVVGANRAYLSCLQDNGQKNQLIYEWCDHQTSPKAQHWRSIDTSALNWWIQQLKQNRSIIISDLAQLPIQAQGEKEQLQSQQITSTLVVPIFDNKKNLWGSIGFENHHYSPKHWSEDDSRLLRVVGRVIYTYCDRQAAQTQLKASEALYSSIFNDSTDGIFLIDIKPDQQLVYETVNISYRQMLGLEKEEIAQKTLRQVLPPHLARLLERHCYTCLKNKQLTSYEYSIRTGKIHYITLIPIRNSQGKIVKLQGCTRDITEEREAIAQQIRQTRYRHLLRSVTLKTRQSFNVESILQTTVQELQTILQADRVVYLSFSSGQNCQILAEATAFPIPHKIDANLIHQIWQKQAYFDKDVYIQLADKQKSSAIQSHLILPILPHWLKDSFSPEPLAEKKLVSQKQSERFPQQLKNKPRVNLRQIWGLLSIQQYNYPRQWTEDEIESLQQLTEQISIAIYQQKLIKQEIKQKEELSRSNAELEQFAYIASHDLQAPLQLITSYAQLIQRRYQGKLDEKGDKFINHIINSSKQMQTQIKDLLSYSRLGKSNKPWELVDFNLLVKQAIENLSVDLEKKKATVDIPHQLPQTKADFSQMLLLFQNLIANGIKYNQSESPRVTIEAKREAKHWLFTIEDNGIGINPKYKARIFQIFQRLHTEDEYPGTGIGLALCHRIVSLHQGKIWFESQEDQGAKFYFTLPTQIKS